MDLTSYRPLGRSGLVVSPLALGTMTFGTDRWGAHGDDARAIFDAYLKAGGNLVDTADIYSGGRSEELVGSFIEDAGVRDEVVLATKFSFNQDSGMPGSPSGATGNPNAGGNGRKNVHRALDASLKRLRTDYVDLYWLHFWDMVTPADEVLETFADLIRSGRVRYYALSDVPAWYVTRVATLAQARGLPQPIAIQTQYSLVERSAEFEHVPSARELGMAIQPWSPLAGGFLTGKYQRDDGKGGGKGEGRLAGANPLGQTPFTDRNWDILDVVRQVADELGATPADVALAWTVSRPGVGSVLIGASRPDQLTRNVAALDIALSPGQLARLDEASVPPPAFPWSGFGPDVRRTLFGGFDVQAWRS